MSKSITTLTTTADKVLSDMYAKVPSLKPIFIGAGGLIGIYLITGIIANIKSVHDA